MQKRRLWLVFFKDNAVWIYKKRPKEMDFTSCPEIYSVPAETGIVDIHKFLVSERLLPRDWKRITAKD